MRYEAWPPDFDPEFTGVFGILNVYRQHYCLEREPKEVRTSFPIHPLSPFWVPFPPPPLNEIDSGK